MTFIRVIETSVNADKPKASKKTKRFIELRCDICDKIWSAKYTKKAIENCGNMTCSRSCGAIQREKLMSLATKEKRSKKHSVNTTKNNITIWASLSFEERETRKNNIRIGTLKGMSLMSSDEKLQSNSNKSSGLKKMWAERHDEIIASWVKTMKSSRKRGPTKPERKAWDILRSFFGDENVDYQAYVNGWMIDFYVKSIETYVQIDGIYWHGVGCNEFQLLTSGKSRDLKRLRTLYVDKKQNEWFTTNNVRLVRVTDVEMKRLNDDSFISLVKEAYNAQAA